MVTYQFHLHVRIPSDEVFNRMAQLLVLREGIWTVDDVGRYIGIAFWKL